MTVTTNVHIRCEGIFSSIIVAFWSLLWKDIFSKPEAESHTDLWLCVSQKKKPPPLPVVQVPLFKPSHQNTSGTISHFKRILFLYLVRYLVIDII